MNRPKPRGLGRGLESLIPLPSRSEGGSIQMISIDQVRASPEQMRRRFDSEPLRELADSIRAHGLLQPVLVRRHQVGFELIAGERRWRAARMAGLERIPAVVREASGTEDQLILGLIENLMRENLDPMEEARGLSRLIEQYGLTHEQAAERVGRNRVSVSQALRLLNGCPAVQSAVSSGAITAGHARALVGLPGPAAQEHGLKVVLARRFSVRQTERWVQTYQPPRVVRRIGGSAPADPDLVALATGLEARLQLPVSISGGPGSGRITIAYSTPQELDRLRAILLG